MQERDKSKRPGQLRLVRADDDGQQFIGWLPPEQEAAGSLVNRKGWAMLRVVVQMLKEGRYQDAYDQVVLVENPGAVVACRLGDQIGLVQNFRFVGRRLFEAGADYVKRLDREGRLGQLVGELGEWQWEMPRGLAPKTFDKTDLEWLIIQTAKAEALEESGYAIANPRLLGIVNANTGFFAHAQYVVGADIVAHGDSHPEELELIGRARLFTAAEIRRMADSGEMTDGLTLAALALIGFSF